MKTTVNNYIYSTYNERGMKAFENKVAKLLNNHCINGEVICLNAWKERASGYGQYYNCIELSINGSDYYLTNKNNDSVAWDNWFEPTAKDKRNLFLSVLENKINVLHDEIKENYEE